MAKRGCRALDRPLVSFKHSSSHNDEEENIEPHEREVRSKGKSLGISVDMTRIFTIFCVAPLVSVYRFRRSLTSMSLI